EWDGASGAQRLELLRAFASGDGCLSGLAREINFYRKGRLVGVALPVSGVQLLGNATAQAVASSAASSRDLAACPN
ncbi:MAG: hypothetical protein ABI409_01080, partial [Ramlibacter sp.]